MSTMNGNPHYENSIEAIEAVHDWQGREGETDATMVAGAIDALNESTLALAFEQRTANLMQFLVDQEGDEARKLWAQVAARLGLSGDAS